MESTLTPMSDMLLTHTWQIAAVFVVVAGLCMAGRKASAHWRYLLWLVVLVKCIVPPIVTVPLAVLPTPTQPAATPTRHIATPTRHVATPTRHIAAPTAHVAAPTAAMDEFPAAWIPTPPVAPADADRLAATAPPAAAIVAAPMVPSEPIATRILSWAPLAWIAGAALFGLHAAAAAVVLRRRLRRTRRDADPALAAEVTDAADLLGMTTPPRAWQVDGICQPFVWGWWRGDVFLPSTFGQLPAAHRRSILLHELAHVSRCDAAVNILQIVVQSLLFFHPLVWWLNRKLRQEREKCCDEVAVAVSHDTPARLGEAIVNTLIVEHQSRHPLPSLAIAGPAKNIEERIRTMMHRKTFHKRPSMLAAATVLAAAALLVPTALTLTARAAKAAPAPAKQAAPSAGKFTATFSDGSTAELVAVSNLKGGPKQWWRPDGTELSVAPCPGKDVSKQWEYELVMRLDPATANDIWNIDNTKSFGKYDVELHVRAVTLVVDSDLRRDLRYGLAAGDWTTQAEYKRSQFGSHFSHLRPRKPSVAFSPPTEDSDRDELLGQTELIVAWANTAERMDCRVVATTSDGQQHEMGSAGSMVVPNESNRASTAALGMYTCSTPQPLKNIESFQFQTRPYEWVEFKNISFKPGYKTKFHILDNTPGSEAEIFPGVIRRYVGKDVADFPATLDQSTPEAAAAAWNRAWGAADVDTIMALSSHNWPRSQVQGFFKTREATYDKSLLDSQVVEVLTYKQGFAKVITLLRFPEGKGRQPYSLRSFGLFDGKWKNLGEDRSPSVEDARETFNRKKDRLWKFYRNKATGANVYGGRARRETRMGGMSMGNLMGKAIEMLGPGADPGSGDGGRARRRTGMDNTGGMGMGARVDPGSLGGMMTRPAGFDPMADASPVLKEAKRLFDAIKAADYDYYLAAAKGGWRRDQWQQFPAPGVEYRVNTDYPGFALWASKIFKDNPITSYTLGEVGTDKRGRPVVRYAVHLKDGAILSGDLPLEFDSGTGRWYGVEGVDWHLKYPKGPPASTSAKVITALLSSMKDAATLKETNVYVVGGRRGMGSSGDMMGRGSGMLGPAVMGPVAVAPETIIKEAQRLFGAIRVADYDYYLAAAKNGWKRDQWQQFPAPGVEYRVNTNYPGFALWASKTFKDNPITFCALGGVGTDKRGRPVVRYAVHLKDGAILSGDLPFEFDSRTGRWYGVEGVDWHLKYPKGPPAPTSAKVDLSTPEATILSLLRAYAVGDNASAMECIRPDIRDVFVQTLSDPESRFNKMNGTIAVPAEIVKQSLNGDRCTVTFRVRFVKPVTIRGNDFAANETLEHKLHLSRTADQWMVAGG